ncbi:hypothetical protein DESPIG_01411 [Desulfovibrio piger ATCC 29098]|uniref:Uncharacterized protein n=1 Tax=Desulfovibrio piger ATCC 29098 TaxID=411464 RepID=B6WTK5_9BACT|nr:hypothetical protein DESPIG_01411 [Desulfovibrio piger ATCC 29098]
MALAAGIRAAHSAPGSFVRKKARCGGAEPSPHSLPVWAALRPDLDRTLLRILFVSAGLSFNSTD